MIAGIGIYTLCYIEKELNKQYKEWKRKTGKN